MQGEMGLSGSEVKGMMPFGGRRKKVGACEATSQQPKLALQKDILCCNTLSLKQFVFRGPQSGKDDDDDLGIEVQLWIEG